MTTGRRFTQGLAVALAAVFWGGVAVMNGHAQEVITPTNATSTTTIGGSRTIDAVIDGTLLSSGGTSSNILEETVTYAGSSGHWLSASSAVDDDANFRSTTEVLTFDLGGTYDVNAFHLWPYIRSEKVRGIRTCDISFSTDGGGTYPTTIPAATLGDFALPTGDPEPVQTKVFATQSGVTHILLTNLTTFGSTSYIAISELRFGSPGATPPPPSEGGTVGIETMVLNISDVVGTIQWQKSADGSAWSEVSGAASPTLDVTGLYTDTPWFRVEAISGTNAPAYSASVKVQLSSDGSELRIY